MDILKEYSPDNYDEVRGRMLSLNSNISRDNSISSMKSFVAYHERIECNNAIDVNNTSPELFYEISQEKALHLSTVAEKQTNTRSN